jgi:tetratricopeptide (TPR) repeat protein
MLHAQSELAVIGIGGAFEYKCILAIALMRIETPPPSRPSASPNRGKPLKRIPLIATPLTAAFLVVLFWHAPTTSAQEGHQHQHEHSEKLGRVNFPVSCTTQARKQFNRAVAWLHSFEYEEAEKVFTEVTVTDPRCGMGYWGIAMSNYHPLWAPPNAAELQKGSAAIERARAAGARTQRERDYIAAIERFYKGSDRLDHRSRTFTYSEAMEELYRRYPSDDEAGVLYALTLISKGMMASDKSYANEKKAAQILNRVLARKPQHPGVAHYLIHSYDYPALANLALPAARSYARIAPASAHAQHMPSHIFTRLGLWQEAIRSNLDAKATAKAYAIRNRMPGAWDEQLHAMDYLAYAYLQGAQDKQARGVLDELYKIRKVDPPNFKVAYAFTAIPARYALERRQWGEAAKLALHPGTMEEFPWQRFPWAEAQIHFARAIGAVHIGDTASARQGVEKLAEIRQALAEVKGDYDWGKQVEIKRQVASAWLAYSEGEHEQSLRLMRAAAELDDATEKHPVTPGTLLPAREQLGELLLELKQPAAALQEFETSLRIAPNRFNGLYGAARAARLASDQKVAKNYYIKLMALCRKAESTRAEIEEAKRFLAGMNVQDSVSTR